VKADQKTVSPASDQEHRVEPSSNGTSSAPAKTNGNRSASPGWHIWLVRIRALLFVTLCATFGVLLLILPWTPKWTDNPLLLSFPSLRDIVSSGFVRGVASGLGLMDLWLGFWEAIHYHETPMGC
jgi:hypothetical protein